jgi:hypothetical protein
MSFSLDRGHANVLIYNFDDNTLFDDISTFEFWFTVKESIGDDDSAALIAKTEADMTVLNNTGGDPMILTIPLTESDMDITPGHYYYDLWCKRGNTLPANKFDSGRFDVTQPVTRSIA